MDSPYAILEHHEATGNYRLRDLQSHKKLERLLPRAKLRLNKKAAYDVVPGGIASMEVPDDEIVLIATAEEVTECHIQEDGKWQFHVRIASATPGEPDITPWLGENDFVHPEVCQKVKMRFFDKMRHAEDRT